MKVAVKTIQTEDYAEVTDEFEQLTWLVAEGRYKYPSARIDACDTLGHRHKMWEWARTMKAINEVFGPGRIVRRSSDALRILDIGAAFSPLGPALAYLGDKVTEAEPDASCGGERAKVNQFLYDFNHNPINWIQAGYGTLAERCPGPWDVVLSISVIEHVDLWLEKTAWKEMADLVRPGGLLVVTMDCMPQARKGYQYDDVRWTNYDMKLVRDRVTELKSYGLKPLGAEDYTYHGNFVNDYSFAFLAMTKV